MSFLVLQQNTGQLLNHPNLNAENIVIIYVRRNFCRILEIFPPTTISAIWNIQKFSKVVDS